MALNLQNAKAKGPGNARTQGDKAAGALAKAPALSQLQVQIETQGAQLEQQARDLVQAGVAETRERVRQAVQEELEACGDDDFFGFSSLFMDNPVLEELGTEALTITVEQSV
jgi:hypothetical protein